MKGTFCCKPAFLAEFIGTFLLTLLVSVTVLGPMPEWTPFVAAMTLGVCVYTIGPVSGCHINPSVTLGLLSVRKIAARDAILYIVVQVLGALVARGAIQMLTGAAPTPLVENIGLLGVAEFMGALILSFGVSAVVRGKVNPAAAGLTIGGSLFLGILVASTVGNGVINPAVAIGIASVSPMYMVGPLLGGIAGAWLYRLLD